jgi:hypothetical protein
MAIDSSSLLGLKLVPVIVETIADVDAGTV